MDFHAEFFPESFKHKIIHKDKIMLIGSCFTEQIGNKLGQHKFSMLQNPNGILFNPISICEAIRSYIEKESLTEDSLFYFNELWNSWKHHTRFSGIDKECVLAEINTAQNNAHDFLKNADWLMITLGSAFVYELTESMSKVILLPGGIKDGVAANCHKVPADKFDHRLLENEEVKNALRTIIDSIRVFNPTIKIIFTISPVRHLREGFIENNRSKAALINAVHQVLSDEVFYFPAYELIIDDLRDYRFFAEDMVHPNYAATNYVWEKFINCTIDEPSQSLMKEIASVLAARNHKPFNPSSEQHKKFMSNNLSKARLLVEKYPYLNLIEEMEYFSA